MNCRQISQFSSKKEPLVFQKAKKMTEEQAKKLLHIEHIDNYYLGIPSEKEYDEYVWVNGRLFDRRYYSWQHKIW